MMKLIRFLARSFQKSSTPQCSPNKHINMEQQGTTPQATSISPKPQAITISEFHPLRQSGKCFYLAEKRPFSKTGSLKKKTIEAVFDFAYEMAFTEKHRATRSGGKKAGQTEKYLQILFREK